MRRITTHSFSITAALSLLMIVAAIAAPGDITLISKRAANQVTSMYGSYGARISSDGMHLAFFSTSPDLVPQFARADKNLYVRNLVTATTVAVSISAQPQRDVSQAIDTFAISANGRYVAFTTTASNVVNGDTNGVGDVFVRDLQTGVTERVSVRSDGAQGAQVSYAPSISDDGRYVAFASRAANLVSGDTNQWDDVFVHDRQTGVTERVSINSAGVQGNGLSFAPVISGTGRYVAFTSNATNLVPGDTNGVADIFVRDRQTGATERVSVGVGSTQPNAASGHASISSDGRYVAFSSDASNLVSNDTNGTTDIFVRDRQARSTARVNVTSNGGQTSGLLGNPSISADGRFVAFSSDASTLVTNDTNNAADVFVHDTLTGQTMLASISTGGLVGNLSSSGGSLSADGHYLALDSTATNLVSGDLNGAVDVFVRDRQASTLSVASKNKVSSTAAGSLDLLYDYYDAQCYVGTPSISADGRYVAFVSTAPDLVAGEPNNKTAEPYVFVRDRQSATTVQLIPQVHADRVLISGDGSTVAVWGSCVGTSQVVNRTTGAADLLPADAYDIALNSTGRYVSFTSSASNLVPGDTNGTIDLFIRDRQSGITERVNVSSDGSQTTGSFGLGKAAISADGRYVAFYSGAPDLVASDTNGVSDVYVRDRQLGTTERISVDGNGQEANGASLSYWVGISDDGRFVAFQSDATNLVAGDTDSSPDVFVKDRQTGQVALIGATNDGIVPDGSCLTLSPDGRYVAIGGTAYDRQTGTASALLTGAAVGSYSAPWDECSLSQSADQRFVAFGSYNSLVKADLNASALDPAGYASVALDIYVQERAATTATSSLTVSPMSLAFGNQRINTVSAAMPVTVTNITSTAVPFTGVSLTGSPGQFSFTHNCGTSLAGGAKCTVNVKFKPTTKGTKSATLNVNGGGGGQRSVALTGTGI